MDKTQKYHQRWIKNIAKRTSKLGIKRHIIHHAKQLKDPMENNPIGWGASMYNLLEIYEKVHCIKITTDVQIYKNLNKYRKNPKTFTPPPGNKIPQNVRVKKVNDSTK